MAEKIYESIAPPCFVPTEVSLHQFLLACNPDDVAADKVIVEDHASPGKELSYGGLRDAAAIGAAGLKSKFGLELGDVVIIIARNSVDYVHLAHSVMWFGGIIAGINYMASPHDIRHYLDVAEPKLIVVEPDFQARVEDSLVSSLLKPPILELGGSSPTSFPEGIVRGQRPLPVLDLSGKDSKDVIACMMFSSGTSGKPKGVQMSHYNLLAYLLSTRAGTPETTNAYEREVFFVPCAHIFGFVGVVLFPAFFGSYVMVMPQFDYQKWIEANANIKATTMKMVPAIAVAMAKDPNVEKLDLSSVNVVLAAGGTLQVEVVQKLQKLLKGVSVVQGYGMSETSVSALRAHRSVDKAGSVGRIFPSVQLRLVDESLNDVPIGVTGEALIKGPMVFRSYRSNPKATKDAFHNGWLRTGDALQMDKDGFLWFQDRLKEMIKYKGNQVAPGELEDLLASHPDVLEAAVCGTWDQAGETEIPVGYVCLQPSIKEADRQAALAKILASVNERVSGWKKIRGGLHYIPAIPKNPTGKVMRSLLPARVEAAAAALAASRPAKM